MGILPRLLVSQLLKRTSHAELAQIGGKDLQSKALLTQILWKLSPWILAISMILSWSAFRWLSLLLIPVLGGLYFVNSFQGIRAGNPWGPSLMLAAGLALLVTGSPRNPLALFFAVFSLSMFLNRLGWWLAGKIAIQYPQWIGTIQQGNQANTPNSDGIADAEVVEISDVEPIAPLQLR